MASLLVLASHKTRAFIIVSKCQVLETAKVERKKLDYDAARRRVHPNLDIDAGPLVKITASDTSRCLRKAPWTTIFLRPVSEGCKNIFKVRATKA